MSDEPFGTLELPASVAFAVEPTRRYRLVGRVRNGGAQSLLCVIEARFGDQGGGHLELSVPPGDDAVQLEMPLTAPLESRSLDVSVSALDADGDAWLEDELRLLHDTRIPLSDGGGVVRTYPVEPGRRVLLSGALGGQRLGDSDAALMSLEFLDVEGLAIDVGQPGLLRSEREDIGHYMYLREGAPFQLWLDPPPGSRYARARFRRWKAQDAALVSEPRLTSPAAARPHLSSSALQLPQIEQFVVEPSARYMLRGRLVADEPGSDVGAMLTAEFQNADGRTLDAAQEGWHNDAGAALRRHVPVEEAGQEGEGLAVAIRTPPTARTLQLVLTPWAALAGPRLIEPLTAELDPRITLTHTPIEREYELTGRGEHTLRLTLLSAAAASERAGLASAQFLDRDGETIAPPYRWFRTSPDTKVGEYQYLATDTAGAPSPVLLRVQPPPGAARLRMRFMRWDRQLGGQLQLAAEPTLDPTTPDLLAELADEYWDDVPKLQLIATAQSGQGELTAHVATIRRINELTGNQHSGWNLRRSAGVLRELDTNWLPRVPGVIPMPRSAAGDRICHLFKVTYPFESSGGAIRNLNTVVAQRRAGLSPYVITPLNYPAIHGVEDALPEEDVEGVPHIRLGLDGGDDHRLPNDLRLEYDALLTASVIRRRGADVIHAASGFRGFELALKGLAIADHFDLPMVYEVRSLHEHLWGDVTDGHALEREWTQLRIAQENRCMNAADAVVTIADAMRDLLVERGVPAEKIVVVPNAVDAARFSNHRSPERLRRKLRLEGKTVVGYVSNVSRREGHDILLRAFARVAATRDDAVCLIVGAGALRNELERLAATLEIGGRVVFTGEVDHADINDYYSLIDVFVVPRRADYAADFVTPLKPYEALALERPIIVSDRPSLREIVGDEERGLIFRTEDDEHLAARIEELLDAPDRRAELGRRGRDWVLRERTWERNAERYRELYGELLSSFRGRSAVPSTAER